MVAPKDIGFSELGDSHAVVPACDVEIGELCTALESDGHRGPAILLNVVCLDGIRDQRIRLEQMSPSLRKDTGGEYLYLSNMENVFSRELKKLPFVQN